MKTGCYVNGFTEELATFLTGDFQRIKQIVPDIKN